MKKFLLCALAVAGISASLSAQTLNKLTPKEKQEGYKLLFDGKTTDGWHIYLGHDAGAWHASDGALVLDTAGKEQGDLVTDKEYTNFELKIDWKISPGGNSGIIFSIHEDTTLHYTFFTGMEMQVLDDKLAEDNKQPNHLAGSLYDMIAPSHPAKPAGEWNAVIIRKLNGHITLWMNRQQVVDVQMGSPEWNAYIQKSKFRKWPNFAKFQTGHISLQDHGAEVEFRNIRIKQL
ncbi:3-keto-disaccharide hydrolase [Mucilaginibacter sp.]